MPEPLPPLDDECFFIAPIGVDGSDIRNRSDGVMSYIVKPAAAAVGLVTVRADTITKPGQINRQVIEHVVGAKAAVVDLTGANANVYYEMAVRHTSRLPTVLIASEGEKLPFDIAQMRTIFFDHTDLRSAAGCSEQITAHLNEALNGEVDSPISASVAVQSLESGTPQDKVLAQLADGMDDVRHELARIARRSDRPDVPPAALRDLAAALTALDELVATTPQGGVDGADSALYRGLKALRHLDRHGQEAIDGRRFRSLGPQQHTRLQFGEPTEEVDSTQADRQPS